MKRSRSLAAFTRTKRRLIVTIVTAAVLLISSCAAIVMVQFHQADYQALEQRGATRKTLDSFRALSTKDERNPLAMRLKAYSDWHRAKFLHIPSGDQETLRLQELDSNDRDRWFTDWRVQSDTHLLRL